MSQIFIFSYFQTKKILIENTRVSEYIVVKIMTVGKNYIEPKNKHKIVTMQKLSRHLRGISPY